MVPIDPGCVEDLIARRRRFDLQRFQLLLDALTSIWRSSVVIPRLALRFRA